MIFDSLLGFAYELYDRLTALLFVPAQSPDVLWLVAPLILALVLMGLYFGRYKYEGKGWDNAFGNCVALLFVSTFLAEHLYEEGLLLYVNVKSAIVLVLLFLSVLLFILGFFHLLPRPLVVGLSSFLSINVLAYLGIAFVYADLPADYISAIAAFLFAAFLVLLIKFIQNLIPEAIELEE